MMFKVKLFDAKGRELEIENKIIGELVFESKQAFDHFINAIRECLPPDFQYKVISKKVNSNNDKK